MKRRKKKKKFVPLGTTTFFNRGAVFTEKQFREAKAFMRHPMKAEKPKPILVCFHQLKHGPSAPFMPSAMAVEGNAARVKCGDDTYVVPKDSIVSIMEQEPENPFKTYARARLMLPVMPVGFDPLTGASLW